MDGMTPARNLPTLAALDPHQDGLPRVIHPVGLAVGRPDLTAARTGETSMEYAGDIKITEDITVTDASGTPFRFKKGDRISAARAASFPDLAKQIEGTIMGTDEARMVYGAPENRMEPAPENRGAGMLTSETAAQKKAREKAEKEAAEKDAVDEAAQVAEKQAAEAAERTAAEAAAQNQQGGSA